jgi:hypothetical protein
MTALAFRLALTGLFWLADFAKILDDSAGGGLNDADAPALCTDVLPEFEDVNPLVWVHANRLRGMLVRLSGRRFGHR